MSENIPLHIGSDPTLPLSTPVINQIIEAISPTVSVETISGGHEVTITDKNGDHTFDVMDGGAGGMDYDNLENKPQIEGVTLTGDTTLASLGAASTEDIPDISGLYTKPDDGIPSTDMTSAVQTSLGKADSAYQVPSGGIPSTDMATAVQTSLGKADSAYQKPGSGIPGTDLASGVLTSIIDDTAGDGDTNKVWSADKSADLMSALTFRKGEGEKSAELYGEYYGYSNSAEGVLSVANGVGSVAYGNFSHAEGMMTKAIGQNSRSEGSTSVARASSSHAEGSGTLTNGQGSHAEGSGLGKDLTLTGAEDALTYSVTGGSVTEDDVNAFISYKNIFSYIESVDTTNNTVTLDTSFGEALSDAPCHVYYGGAWGNASHSEGYGTIAQGAGSHAEGAFNARTDRYPLWIANQSYSVGDRVTRGSVGYVCIEANSDSSWNASKWALSWIDRQNVLMVGNGYSNAHRSNAFAVDAYGNGHFNGDVYVGCNPNSSGGTKLPKDVQINGESIVNDGVANIPIATGATKGVVRQSSDYGVRTTNDGLLYIETANDARIKLGSNSFYPITPNNQHSATFYGLAKAAGNIDQSSSSNAVGVYTDDAKLKIQQMMGLWTPKIYIKCTLDEEKNNFGDENFPFNDTEINIYEELVICVYQSDTTQTGFASNNFGYLTIRDAINSAYITVSNMYLQGTKQCSIMRIKRLPNAIVAELINDGNSTYVKACPRSLDYVDKIRWINASVANGTFKAGTTIETYISRFY